MNIKVTQEEWKKLLAWEKTFRQADRIKKLAWEINCHVSHEILDKRVKKAWDKVKELEPFDTFDSKGMLHPKAAMILNMIKIKKIWKTANIIQIN